MELSKSDIAVATVAPSTEKPTAALGQDVVIAVDVEDEE